MNFDDKRVTCKSVKGRQKGERTNQYLAILIPLHAHIAGNCAFCQPSQAQRRKMQSQFGRDRYKQVPSSNPLICFVPTKDRDAQACCRRCETGTRNALRYCRARDSRASEKPCEWCKGISRDGPGTWHSEVPCTARRGQTVGGKFGRLAPIHKRKGLAESRVY